MPKFTMSLVRVRRIDGCLTRLWEDGREELVVVPDVRPMTETEIEAAALSDPDARPLAADDLKPVSRAKVLRRALTLTQDRFAALALAPR